MRIVRFAVRGKASYGVLDDNRIRRLRRGPFFRPGASGPSLPPQGEDFGIDEVRLLAPCLPSKLVCLGLNYRSHIEETGMPLPAMPLIFLKPSTAVVGPGEEIVIPRQATRVDYEGELAVVIGRKAKDVCPDDAHRYILGYTCFNDVTERHNQRDDGQWTRAKSYDTFAPLGPWIETGLDPHQLKLETYVNGELRQSAPTADLVFAVPRLVSFISAVMTLLPGDVIATGTPAGIGPLAARDVVEVRIDGIGTLTNPVATTR